MNALYVLVGGGLGAVARWWLTQQIHSESVFPFGTLTVNLLGCLCIGIFSVALLHEPKWGLLIVTGFLGGFTTFSSFGLDAVNLLHNQLYKQFFSYVAASNVLGILFVIIGHRLASHWL